MNLIFCCHCAIALSIQFLLGIQLLKVWRYMSLAKLMQMGRRFRLTARKNSERKKSKKQKAADSVSKPFIVKISLRVVSVFPVSIPVSFPMSLPLQVFKDAPAPSVSLRGKILDVLHCCGCERNL